VPIAYCPVPTYIHMLQCAPRGNLMSSAPPPLTPPYRITLFYGPEAVSNAAGRLHCVFNVKKRSWKAGTQVVVEVDKAHLSSTAMAIGLEGWAKTTLAALPVDEQRDAEGRIPDLLAQIVCAIKLNLAIEDGLPQENLTIGVDRFAQQLEAAAVRERQRITEYIRTELDVPES